MCFLFSPSIQNSAYFLNVFEHGESEHPGLAKVAARFFEAIDPSVRIADLVSDSRNTVHSNYFIAKPRFWRAWLEVNERMFAIAETPTDPLGEELRTPTAYRGRVEVHMKIFIMERIATWLLTRDRRFAAQVRDPFAARARIYKLPVAVVCDASRSPTRPRPGPIPRCFLFDPESAPVPQLQVESAGLSDCRACALRCARSDPTGGPAWAAMVSISTQSVQFWRGRRVLITGHTGFKGAWLWLWLRTLGAKLTGYALAPPGHAEPVEPPVTRGGAAHRRYSRCPARSRCARRCRSRSRIIHMAAQALVRESYRDPLGTYATNVLGTAAVLEACRELRACNASIVVTSDKVYENRGDGRPFEEDDRLGGHDPYSSSKACAELVTEKFSRKFFRSTDRRSRRRVPATSSAAATGPRTV